jgi:hypothetical protein
MVLQLLRLSEVRQLSYDLAVFDPAVAPRNPDDFLLWFEQQTEWSEPHSYDNPKVSSAPLRAFFLDIINEFPAMNGPYSPYAKEDPEDESLPADYSVGTSLIYATFAWSKDESAYECMFRLAEKHGLGFFPCSNGNAIWLPGLDGKLVQIAS